MEKKNYLIFDFDGTLVDSFPVILSKLSTNADEFEINISTNEIEVLRELPARALIKYLHIPLYKLPNLIYQVRKALKSEIHAIAPFLGLPEVLRTLHIRGYRLGILTSNSKENVINWLNSFGLDNLFDFICDESSFLRKQKSLKKLLKEYAIDANQAVYIGDETRDIVAAQKNHLSAVAVTWGFNSERILRQYHPQYIVKKPKELLAIFD